MSTAANNPAPEPITPEVVRQASQPPLRVVLEQGGTFGKFGRRMLWIVLGISVLVNFSLLGMYQSYIDTGEDGLSEKYHSQSKIALDKVAIIRVEGTIMSGDGYVKHQIDRVKKDKRVKAIVLRVDSPGGTVTGSDYIYHHLQELIKERQIPMVVSMGSIAASGGYYVSMAVGPGENLIYAEPTTWTGSIGVIIPHYQVAELMKKWDIKDDSISSHPLKQMGSPTAMLPPEYKEQEQKILQELVDESFKGFRMKVLEARPGLKSNPETMDSVFTGRIFTAGQAEQIGLVDKLGFIEDAIDRAIELAKLDKENVRVVKYSKPASLQDALFGSSVQSRSELATLLDLAAPRAYYLCTMLPVMQGLKD